MGDLLRKVYNYYAPAAIVILLAFSGHWVWLLGRLAFTRDHLEQHRGAHARRGHGSR